jgi:hypothetical protein
MDEAPVSRGEWVLIREIGRPDPVGWEWASPSLQPPTDEDYRKLDRCQLEQLDQNFSEQKLRDMMFLAPPESRRLLNEIADKHREELLQARARSMELLQEWLNADEYKALTEIGELEIPSAAEADVVFVVKRDPQSKVLKKVKGEPVEHLCVVPEEDLPDGDVLLSKILLLKCNEPQFIKIANRYPIAR